MIQKNSNLHIYTERHILRNPSLTVIMKLSVDGHFDELRFEKTLQTLKDVHPLLYSSVVIAADGAAYYRENSVQKLELHCIKGEHQNQWLETAEAENKQPINCETGPLIRFFVFYNETDFDILAIVHHLLGDGNAISRLLRDIVSAYAGVEISRKEQVLIASERDFPLNAVPAFSVKAFTHLLNKMWDKGKQPRFGQAEYQELFFTYHQTADIGLFYSTINADAMTALYKECKAHGVTLNSAVVAAFICAMQEHYRQGSKRKTAVGIPINIRKQLSLSADDCLGNFSSAVTVKAHYDTKKDFWYNAALIQNKLKIKLSSAKASWVVLNLYTLMNPLLIDAMYFAAYGKCDDKAANRAASLLSIDNPSAAAISNLGRLNFDCHIGFYHIRDLVFFAPKAPGSYAVLGIATLGDTMHIGFSYDRNIISSDIMNKVSAKMNTLLGE